MPRLTNVQLSKKNPYWLPKTIFFQAYYYCLSYDVYKDEYKALNDTLGASAVSYDGMPSGNFKVGSETEDIAIRLANLDKKISVIEESVKEACADYPELYTYLFKAVTQADIKYRYLKLVMGIPCTEKKFYALRRKIYYLVAKKAVHVPIN